MLYLNPDLVPVQPILFVPFATVRSQRRTSSCGAKIRLDELIGLSPTVEIFSFRVARHLGTTASESIRLARSSRTAICKLLFPVAVMTICPEARCTTSQHSRPG